MESWAKFLDSLRTGGGRIFVLAVFSLLFVGIVLALVYYPGANKEAAAALVGLLGATVGALVASLRGNIPPNGQAGNGEGE